MSQSREEVISCTGCDADIHITQPRWINGIEAFCTEFCYGRHLGRIEARESLFESANEVKELWLMLETRAERALKAMKEVNPEDHLYRDYGLQKFTDDGAYFEYQYDRDAEVYRFTVPWATLVLPEADLIPMLKRERDQRLEAIARKAREDTERAEQRTRESEIAQLKKLQEKYPEVK